MCWCRIELVLPGLLGLLCVVHVVSGMCGQDFLSTAEQVGVVIQGRVVKTYPIKPVRGAGLSYNAVIEIKKPIFKGKIIIKTYAKNTTHLTLGPFTKKVNLTSCLGPVKKRKTYFFALNAGSFSFNENIKFKLQDLPRRKNKEEYKKLKGFRRKEPRRKGKKTSKPEIKKAKGPTKAILQTGQKMTFKCFAKAKPAPEYRWYRDGVLLKNGNGLSIKTPKSKKYSRLIVRKARATDAGEYRCEVTNPRGTVSKTFLDYSIRDNPKAHRPDTIVCQTQTLCLNGGTCLRNLALDESYCMCRPKWTGKRCEIMDAIRIHGHYSRQATLLYERTLIIVGLAIAVIVFIVICIVSYFLAKRKRKKFEARRKRKQLRASTVGRMKDSATQSYRTDEKTYQPITHDTRSFFPGRTNGFDFEAAQRQPLLRHNGVDDVDGAGPESRRRLVASSMYDNFDEPPTTTSPNRSANVTGLTTAEVAQNPEMIEMSPMENRVVDPVSSAAPPANSSHPGRENAEDEMPYPQSDDSTIPLSQSSPISNHPPDTSSSPTEILQPFLDPDLPPPPSPTTEDLDFEKYTAPPPPILPLSHSNSSPLRNTAPPNSTAPTAAAAFPSRFPTSNSMPTRLVNDIDGAQDPNDIHSSLPHNHYNNNNNNNNNPYVNVPTSNNDLEREQLLQHPLSNNPSDTSLPSYETAILLNGVDDDESDDDIVSQLANNGSSAIEDLHISEEEELGLSSENLPRGSFNSSAHPSRQPSVDTEYSADYNDKLNRRRRFSTDKQQSEDILHPEQFWKRSMLYGQSPRSQSLDTPSNDRVNGTGSNHLDSTVSENQNYDGHTRNNGGTYHHPDDVFDPSDDSSPWDPEQQQKRQQSCNSNYSNLLDEERDRLNRLKDVCPDQPAIPI